MASYYEKNKEKLKKLQRFRYANDPLYRKRKIELSIEHAKRKSEEKKMLKRKFKYNHSFWQDLNIGGVDHKCCSISFLAFSLGRTVKTVRDWEKFGKLPVTFKYNNRRYYTRNHLKLILKYWEKRKKNNLEYFFKIVREKWEYAYQKEEDFIKKI